MFILRIDFFKNLWYNIYRKKEKNKLEKFVRGVDRRKERIMKLANKQVAHAEYVKALMEYFAAQGEDVGQISSHELNFPIVINGEEGWCEIIVKVPNDEDDEGYLKRDSYALNVAEKAEKAEKEKEKKEKKAAADAKRRAEKRAALEAAASKKE